MSEPLRVTTREDYDAILGDYHDMVLKAAAAYGVPDADREDAAQEVELRFFRKDGLAWFDPEMKHEPPPEGWRDGRPSVPRTAKFSSYYRRFVYVHMMQEMDRHNNRTNRVRPVEGGALPDTAARVDEIESADHRVDADRWMERSRRALAEAGDDALIPLLEVCAGTDGSTPSRVKLAAALGVSERVVGAMLNRMRMVLAQSGMGPESLAG